MKKLLLVLIVILASGVFLTGCYNFCGGFVIPVQCDGSVTVVAESSQVYGQIAVNGKLTGIHILPGQSITIYGLPCNEIAIISIVDYCGYWSHEEYVYITTGLNYAIFDYWADYWDGPDGVYKGKGQKGQNSCHKDNKEE